MIVLTLFVAMALLEPVRTLVPRTELVLATGFLVAWMLGQRYERAIIVDAGIADRNEILEVERRSANMWGWGSSKK